MSHEGMKAERLHEHGHNPFHLFGRFKLLPLASVETISWRDHCGAAAPEVNITTARIAFLERNSPKASLLDPMKLTTALSFCCHGEIMSLSAS